jgi:hydrogenase maturation protease
MSDDVVVIGIGNDFRRDDGVGLAVAEELAKRNLPGVRVVTAIGEPARYSMPGPARPRRL